MQSYEQPAQRSTSTNAGALPSKVSVPLPGVNGNQTPYRGGMKPPAPAGFQGGIIPGKI